MREFIGSLIVINGMIVGIFLLREKTIDWRGFSAVALASVAAGVLITNISRVTQFSASKSGVSVNIDQKVQQVETRAQEVEALTVEVRDMRGQIRLLVDNANMTNDKINDSKTTVENLVKNAREIREQVTQDRQTITATSNNLRQTWISFIESFVFAMRTRMFFPPPQAVSQRIDQNLNRLAELAFPNLQERAAWIQRMNTEIQQAISVPPKP